MPGSEGITTTVGNTVLEQENIRICHAADARCTARKGYTCQHSGPCLKIDGNNCPDCGSHDLKFGSRDPREGDYYWCQSCGCGPIQFPLYHQMPAKISPKLSRHINSLIDADLAEEARGIRARAAAIQSTVFADATPFDAERAVQDLVGS